MNTDKQPHNTVSVQEQNLPWYRQFWPWFIIALPASAVIASFITLWLAISNPDHLVVTDNEYRQLKDELKAQQPVKENKVTAADESDPESN
ncbi:MAG: FixH family protein [Xanthomonadales bacterium]|nr:FixH family protein [Xanthomonadales bacterium]